MKKLILLLIMLFSSNLYGADVDGFDFPVGYPDGVGWNIALDFLDWYDYGGTIGNVIHHAEDWNMNGTSCDGDEGQPIYAAANGIVTALPDGCSWGTLVIRHDGVPGYGTVWTVYGHMCSAVVGYQTVSRGDLIGYVDDKSNSSCDASMCAHLHFEIRIQDLSACYFPAAGSGGDDIDFINARYVDPSNFINANRVISTSYQCQFNSQSPNSYFWTKPGEILNLWVKFTNTGTNSWVNLGGVGVENYVELWSCDVNGNIVDSWFEPVGWINRQRITTCNEATVTANGGVATFSFQGEVPVKPSNSELRIYFRPTHGGQVMQDWGGMHYYLGLDADNPSTPANLTATPSSSSTNSFSFSWSASTDAHSGVAGYLWSINGGVETFTNSTSIGPGSYAIGYGTHTFTVRAKDNVGNYSSPANVSFTWNSGSGTCGGYLPPCIAASSNWTGNKSASYEDYIIKLNPLTSDEWATIGQDISNLFEPNKTYRLGFWYRTSSTDPFKIGLQSKENELPGSSIMMIVNHPISDGEWHQYWSAPITINESALSNYPNLVFIKDEGSTGLVEIMDVELYDNDLKNSTSNYK